MGWLLCLCDRCGVCTKCLVHDLWFSSCDIIGCLEFTLISESHIFILDDHIWELT